MPQCLVFFVILRYSVLPISFDIKNLNLLKREPIAETETEISQYNIDGEVAASYLLPNILLPTKKELDKITGILRTLLIYTTTKIQKHGMPYVPFCIFVIITYIMPLSTWHIQVEPFNTVNIYLKVYLWYFVCSNRLSRTLAG